MRKRDPLIGTYAGPWLIDSRLAAGGMSVIYQGLHHSTGAPAAIKTLHAGLWADARMARRFVREGRALASVQHPNVVSVLGLGKLRDGRAYLAMEHVAGHSLEDELAARPGLPVPEAIRIAEQVATALTAVHGKGVVHRDIKPANLMLDPASGAAKLVDFGLACVAGSAAASRDPEDRTRDESAMMGTPGYMSPEQVRGARASPANDLYALGAVLFRMLTGERPFESRSALEEMRRHVLEPARPPSMHRSGVPPALDALVLRLLEKRPERRPRSAREAADELRRLRGRSGERSTVTAPCSLATTERVPVLGQPRASTGMHPSRRLLAAAALAAMLVAAPSSPAGRIPARAEAERAAQLEAAPGTPPERAGAQATIQVAEAERTALAARIERLIGSLADRPEDRLARVLLQKLGRRAERVESWTDEQRLRQSVAEWERVFRRRAL